MHANVTTRRPGSIAVVLLAVISGCAGPTHRVIEVTDGDTIKVLKDDLKLKVRLAGIDAPESQQAYGNASTRHLTNLVADRDVSLDCGKIDRYKREVCVVMVDGKDANLAQVQAGMAWWYRKYQNEQKPQQRADYEAAEGVATAAKRGLWVDAEPVPPWEWRRESPKN
jgi:endonuclease YncB( thermonuclease family)